LQLVLIEIADFPRRLKRITSSKDRVRVLLLRIFVEFVNELLWRIFVELPSILFLFVSLLLGSILDFVNNCLFVFG